MVRARLAIGICLFAPSAGCGDVGPVSADTDASARDASSVSADAPPSACGGVAIDVVIGRVTDEAGAPLAGARPQLCVRRHGDGRLVCLTPPTADTDGSFEIRVPVEARCMERAAMRVLMPSSRLATAYCPVSLEVAVRGALAIAEPFTLYDVPLATTPPLGDPGAARRVTLGDVLTLTVSPDEVGGERDYARLGARPVDPSRSCVPEARALAGLIAATPEASDLSAPFRAHAGDLAAGERVDLFVIGGLASRLPDGTEVEEAALVRFGGGVVASDGWIDPDQGVTLPHLGWLGWAPAR